jgi:hypothetical protein
MPAPYLRKSSDSHHWHFRCTLHDSEHPMYSGKRLVMSLETHDKKLAEERRDFLLKALHKGNFLTSGSKGLDRITARSNGE